MNLETLSNRESLFSTLRLGIVCGAGVGFDLLAITWLDLMDRGAREWVAGPLLGNISAAAAAAALNSSDKRPASSCGKPV